MKGFVSFVLPLSLLKVEKPVTVVQRIGSCISVAESLERSKGWKESTGTGWQEKNWSWNLSGCSLFWKKLTEELMRLGDKYPA